MAEQLGCRTEPAFASHNGVSSVAQIGHVGMKVAAS